MASIASVPIFSAAYPSMLIFDIEFPNVCSKALRGFGVVSLNLCSDIVVAAKLQPITGAVL